MLLNSDLVRTVNQSEIEREVIHQVEEQERETREQQLTLSNQLRHQESIIKQQLVSIENADILSGKNRVSNVASTRCR